jgi:hypothetical protein
MPLARLRAFSTSPRWMFMVAPLRRPALRLRPRPLPGLPSLPTDNCPPARFYDTAAAGRARSARGPAPEARPGEHHNSPRSRATWNWCLIRSSRRPSWASQARIGRASSWQEAAPPDTLDEHHFKKVGSLLGAVHDSLWYHSVSRHPVLFCPRSLRELTHVRFPILSLLWFAGAACRAR